MKKLRFLFTIIIGFMIVMLFQRFAPPPPPSPLPDVDPQVLTFEQTPPDITHIWVRKLQSALPNGNNMLMELEIDVSACYDTLTDTVDLYYGASGQKITFRDNGTAGDVTAYDKIYSAYVTENISAFRTQVVANETELTNNGHYLKFTGHLGEDITTIPHFDAISFDNFQRVELKPDIAKPSVYIPCHDAIDKARSLLITDTSVVEDKSRTYNITNGKGNPVGAWTFGILIRNIVNSSASNAKRNFLKSWVRNYANNVTVNGQTIPSRMDILPLLVVPWLTAAHVNMSGYTESTWEIYWDTANEDSLLKYAPFKLMAIVNRIDLRGNTSFFSLVKNSGETRFIYTLIWPTYGTPVNQANTNIGNALDWRGFNVIFEFGNTQANICEIKTHAQRWKDLSSYTPGTPDFNDRLQVITDYVTAANAAPSKTNRSAINRIRTNERIFYRILANGADFWNASDWEFRQFELDPGTHALAQVPLTNTPVNTANSAQSTDGNLNVQSITTPPLPPIPVTTNATFYLTDWMFSSYAKAALHAGNHNMPKTYSYPSASTINLLAGSGTVFGEFAHYVDIQWDAVGGVHTPNYNSTAFNSKPDQSYEKQMRQQLSLNTCQGCHNGETKTIFTQISPLAYGETANYTGASPDYNTGIIDDRFAANTGLTGPSDLNYTTPSGNRHFVKVSAFLTGRNYSGPSSSLPTFADDSSSTTENATDNTMEGLFYVKDPANGSNFGVKPINKKWGYNDLERRRIDMCNLLNSSCTFSVLDLSTKVVHKPFPWGGH